MQDGLYRDKWDNGDTAIGSKYFRRSGKDEGRMYFLKRFHQSGRIEYHEEVWGKDTDCRWKVLSRYSFNPLTLDWTKI